MMPGALSAARLHRRKLRVRVQPRQDQVDAEVGPEHDEEAGDTEPGGDQAAVVAGGEADVDDDEVDDPGGEGPGFLGVEVPESAPGVVGPPGAQEDADAKGPEGELEDDELGAVEVVERSLGAV